MSTDPFDKKNPTDKEIRDFFKGLKDQVEPENEFTRRIRELNEKIQKKV